MRTAAMESLEVMLNYVSTASTV